MVDQVVTVRNVRNILLHPATLSAVALWCLGNYVALKLADGFLPFDQPRLAGMPFWERMAAPSVGMIEILALMGVVYVLTRSRAVPDMAARAPAKNVAAREVAALLIYAMLGQAGGWLLGPALGYRPFSFHIAGSLFNCTTLASRGEIWTWMTYNFAVFAVIPYVWFRRRYSATQLNLKSAAPWADLALIVVILILEGAWELANFHDIFRLGPHALVVVAPLTFIIFFLGTVLPTMILIYAILLPRYLKLTGSPIVTVLLGGLTYASMHLVEGWSNFSTPRDTALSLLFVVLNYVGPGMFKSFVTLRTGNAWVHAIGYHAIAPHTLVDTPMFAKIFGIR
jgi:hypothetical protein